MRGRMTDFQLIDLISQRAAVRQHLQDRSVDDILAWLAARGQLSRLTLSGREVFLFESAVGFQAVFFFSGNEMVFVVDNTTFK